MARKDTQTATKQPRLPLLGVAGALLLALPSTGLAVVSLASEDRGPRTSAFDVFTPASVDPELAARVAQKARERGIRFTPVGVNARDSERTVTVAVRVDNETARAISIRPTTDGIPGNGPGIAGLQASRFNLGTARGYQSFARTPAPAATVSGRQPALRETLSDLQMPDLADFAPSQPTREDKPSRLQPRIELEDEAIAGRSPNTLDAIRSQTVDVGGSFRLSRNLDVTAGVRLSQERDRLAPLTNSVQDSQAVYVGTQIKF
ncbi:hypothetical protein CD351_02885 [Erythrobacter sp. KY5]|uniref:hypothetical protein n=1 Tax=Erythrobacter sp. KY5 TaxID=2011159 RepID=UPI000DBF395A|nr:hypothetical protein [Erythrobacter sp. KY5]AWW73369.1 hypothetical protein CD351_02885 [Erythrobacter sp. KY5]